MSISVPQHVNEEYQAIGPDGTTVTLGKEAFDTLVSMANNKLSGSVLLKFKCGGVNAVEQHIVRK